VNRLVLCEQEGAVAVLTLNRPDRHNSLVPPVLEQMLAALETVQEQPGIRAIVLAASGRSFSTGGDLRGFHDQRESLEAYAQELVGLLNRVILALVELPLPVVAAVHGLVTGGSLVLGSDVVLVAPEASFTPYYSVVGFSPDGGWTAMLPAIIGPKRAAETLMLNRTITAGQAVAWGLATRVVPADEMRQEALRTARELAGGALGTLRHTKRLLQGTWSDLADRLEAERSRFVQQILTGEAGRGMSEFLEGRLASRAAGIGRDAR
jgi:2-(1,2-epoxy-1,2-dihydrophenyl)acetyl-CoA isomerase